MSTSHRRSVVLLAVCLVMACESRLVTATNSAATWVERGLEPLTLSVGQQRAVALPSGRPASWESSDLSVATVTQQGVVTAQKPGTARIVAYANPDIMSTVVTVIADSTDTPPQSQPAGPAATIAVSLDATSLRVGQTARGTVEARDTSGARVTGKTPTWASQSAEVASVSPTGIVTAVGPGTTMIQATIDGVAGATVLTVAGSSSTDPSLPGQTASVSVILDSTSLAVGHTSQARFVAKDANGVVLTGKAPAWASQGTTIATVSTGGSVTAVSAGGTRIQATVDGIVGSAPLSVTAPGSAPTPRPDSISLVLDAGSYASGSYAIEATTSLSGVGSVQFIVDGALKSTESTAKYCLFGGDASCALGSLGAGMHVIQAKALNASGAVIGLSAVLTIVDGGAPAPAPAPTPPSGPTSGSTAHPNEPAGLSRLASQSMDALSNADYVPSSAGGGRLSIISDPTNPGSSANVAQLLFPAGFGSGSAPESMYPTANPFTPQPKQLYIHFFIKLSSNWYGNTTAGINKILFVTFGTGKQDPVGSAVIEFAAMGGIDGTEQTLQPSVSPEGLINMVNTGDGYSGGPSQTLGINRVPYTTASQVTRGEWHRFEALITLNTPGLSDGGIKWWWDGTLYGDYSNRMRWSGDGAALFQNVVWSPTYGGGAGQTVPADQYMYMKDLYVSGR